MTVKAFEESKIFSTTKDLNKEYKQLRETIIVRHGYKVGDKVKLKNAVRMMMSIDGETFLNCGMVFSDMKDRVKYNEVTNGNAVFKLVALV